MYVGARASPRCPTIYTVQVCLAKRQALNTRRVLNHSTWRCQHFSSRRTISPKAGENDLLTPSRFAHCIYSGFHECPTSTAMKQAQQRSGTMCGSSKHGGATPA